MQLARFRPGTTVRIRGERWRVTRLTCHARTAILDAAGADASNRGTQASFLLPAEHVDPVPPLVRPRWVGASRWRRIARATLGLAVPTFDALRTAACAQIALIPYQLEPALAYARGLGTRMLIADDVGLGKTIQAGLVAAEVLSRHADGRVLIVTPASLREQWAAELDAKFGLRPAVLDARTAGGPHARALTNPWSLHPVVITSIDFVKRSEVLRGLEPLVWDLAVFDEAHTLCGASERAAAAEGIARRSRCVLLLSATPHSGDDAAFARLCRLGMLARDRLLVFRRTRGDAGLPTGRRTRLLRVGPSPAEAAMHRALLQYVRRVWDASGPGAPPRLAMAVLLKRACSGASALARSLERRIRLLTASGSTDAEQFALPFDAADDAEPVSILGARGLPGLADECSRLDALLHLALAAAHRETKVEALRRLLRRARQPALVFTEYRDTLDHLVRAVHLRSVQVHGGLTSSERRDAVRAFTHGDVPLLFATDAASEGLNLQRRCRLVITLELPWTPARLEQRIGRVDRIGQRERVHAIHLVGAGTAEEQIVSRLTARESRARAWTSWQRRAMDEDVASLIVDGAPSPSRPETAGETLDDSLILFPDLRGDAAEEAARLATARALLGKPHEQPPDRPVMAMLPGREGRSLCVCAHVPFVDHADRVLWSIVAGVEIPAWPQGAGRAGEAPTAALCAHLTAGSPPVVKARASAARWVSLSLTRERAVGDDLERQRGRLAAFQPGLFDRRAERHSAARSAELDAALRRCRERVEALETLRDGLPGTPEPVFILLRR